MCSASLDQRDGRPFLQSNDLFLSKEEAFIGRICVSSCNWSSPIDSSCPPATKHVCAIVCHESSDHRERSKQRQMWEQALRQAHTHPLRSPSDVDAAYPVWPGSPHSVGVCSYTWRCESAWAAVSLRDHRESRALSCIKTEERKRRRKQQERPCEFICNAHICACACFPRVCVCARERSFR